MLLGCAIEGIFGITDVLLGSRNCGGDVASRNGCELLLVLGVLGLGIVAFSALGVDFAEAAANITSLFRLLFALEVFGFERGNLLIDVCDLITKIAELIPQEHDFTFEFCHGLGVVIVIHHGMAGWAGLVNGKGFLFVGEFEPAGFDVVALATQGGFFGLQGH